MAERQTIVGDVLYFLKTLLSNNITDPITSRGNTSSFIMTSFPEREVKYPLITITVANTNAIRAGMQSTRMDVELDLEIRVWSKSVTQSDKLGQQILDLLSDKQFVAGGSVQNDFHNFAITAFNRVDTPGDEGTKSRIITIKYQFYNV